MKQTLNRRLAALENSAASDKKYWCEITEAVVIFHGPGKNVILPAKESNVEQTAADSVKNCPGAPGRPG